MLSETLLLLVAFAAMLLLNVPIAFAIGMATLLAILALGNVPTGPIIAQRMIGGIESFPLLAIPMFVLAGTIMGEGGMARRLIAFANSLMGPYRGGLAYVNTLTCMMFGAISGSATAAVSSIGGSMIPEMNAKGYPKQFNVAVTTTAATTGLIIPPSNIMIVYAVVAQNISIAGMFLAGVLPGAVIGFLIMFVCWLKCPVHEATEEEYSWRNVFETGVSALLSLGLIVIVLGGILGGVFTATEASAIAVAYAFLLAVVIYREIPLANLPKLLLQAGRTTGVVMLLISTSQAMAWFLTYQQVPQSVSTLLLSVAESPLVILMVINFTLLVVGTFLDMTPAVLLFTPIFLPVATKLGMDPIHFGIVMITNLCIGLCTPPVGACLFVGCSVGKVTIGEAAKSMIPFYIAMLVGLAIITYVPALSMALPDYCGVTD